MKKFFTILICFLFITAGCGGSGDGSGGGSGGDYAPTAEENTYEALDQFDTGTADTTAETEIIEPDRMVVKNGYMEIEASDSAAFYNDIISRVKAAGGYESGYDISNYETYTVIEATIRIPSDKYDEVVNYIRDTGNVINNRLSTEDITDAYFDTKTRLDTTRTTLKTYYNLLEKASTVEEIIQLQTTIDNITIELEVMEGKLRLWDSQINYSTIELLIRQHDDPAKIRKDIDWNALSFDDMGFLAVSGFTSTADALVVFVQWAIISIVSLLPVIVLLATVYFIIRKTGVRNVFSKRSRSKTVRKNKDYAPSTDTAEKIEPKEPTKPGF